MPFGLRGWAKRRKQWEAFVAVARRFGPYIGKRKGQLALALVCDLGYVLTGLLEPWPIKLILDNVLLGLSLESFLLPVLGPAAADRLFLLNILVGGILVLAFARGSLYFYRQLLTSIVGQKIAADLRMDLYSHLQRLSFKFHDRRSTGDLLTRLTSDIRMLRDIFSALPRTVVGELFLLVSMTVVMLLMDWVLALIALTVLPGLGLLLSVYQRPIKEAIRRQRQQEGRLANAASEVLGAIRVVQGFRRERYELERFGQSNASSLHSGLKATRLAAKLRWGAELSVAAVTALVLGVAARRVLDGALSPGDLLVFVFYLQTFNQPLRRISRIAERTARATACGQRVLGVLRKEPAIQDLPDAAVARPFQGEILFNDVWFSHHKRKNVLSGITLRIQAGERAAIVGPTGAGKTTAVSLIPRFYDPDLGHVCIDHQDVRGFTLGSLRRQIAIVFQEPLLFATTIAENIAYGRPDASMEEIVRAAELAGIHPIISALPEGYDTVIGERGGTLSGGERQCVAIARAIIRDARIVILDEPNAGLDSRSSAMVMEALNSLMQGRTVLMISHDLRSLENADRVFVMEGGRIIEEGSISELRARNGLYQQMKRLQTRELSP